MTSWQLPDTSGWHADSGIPDARVGIIQIWISDDSAKASRVMKKGKKSENCSDCEANNLVVSTPNGVFQHPARSLSTVACVFLCGIDLRRFT